MRALLGWLRGEAKHCSMAATPSLAEEDAKRPSREHEKLGADRTRIMNKMKATLIRLGVRGFTVRLRQAAERLGELRTPEGLPIPPTPSPSCIATWPGSDSSPSRSRRSRASAGDG